MKKIFLFGSLILSLSAYSATIKDIKSQVEEARNSLLVLLKDKTKRGADQQKLVKDTADTVSKTFSGLTAPKGKEKQFEELKSTWEAFKKTREDELVPFILKDKQTEAEAIANGIQKERMGKMKKLIEEISGSDI